MSWTNYHSHSHFCDGKDNPEAYINEAIKQGLCAYGFSSHAPVNFKTDWSIKDNAFEKYLSETRKIKNNYQSEIETYIGLEIDFIPNIAGRRKHLLKNLELDYFIGSIHFIDAFSDSIPWNFDTSKDLFSKGLRGIFNDSFKKVSERFYELSCQMILEDKPDIIGHLDKIKMYNKGNCCFSESDKWYRTQVEHTLDIIKKSGVIVEVNTRGYYRYGQLDLYPSSWIIEKMIKMDIPIMLNSDAHAPNEITSGFEYAANELKKLGLKVLWVLLDNKWQAVEFNQEGLILK